MVDTVLTDVQVVRPTGVSQGAIAMADGEIDAVGDAAADLAGEAERVIDGEGRYALPGVLDVHTHLHDDELFPEGIDFASGTASAAAGGVTTVVELPTQTPVRTPQAVHEKIEAVEELAHVDVGLVAGNFEDPEVDVDVEGIMAAGVPEFKTFTADPYLMDDRGIVELMDRVGDAGGKVRVHCETQGLLDHARAQIDSAEPEVYMDSRPLEAELDAIGRIGYFAEYADCPVHVVHITSGSGAREGARFKSRAKVPFTLETCPHYLAFTKADVAEKGPFLKVNPSLKSPAERERLWDAVQDGTIDLLATDHFPTFREERETGWEDIWEPYAGLPNVETLLEYVISEGVHENRLSWERACELLCARPAREAGLYPKKGTLRPGADADVVLLSEGAYTVSADDLAFNGGWTPYEGQEWTARVDTVFRHGEIVAEDHEVRSQPGSGMFLPRGPLADID